MTSRELLFVGQSKRVPMAALKSAGWQVVTVISPSEAMSAVSERVTKVGIIVLEDEKSTDDVERLICAPSSAEWIGLVTRESIGYPQIKRLATEALYDFHTFPVDTNRLLTTIGRAYGRASLRYDIENDQEKIGWYGMVGRSTEMRGVYRQLELTARVDAPVLITGESGTGKEVAARAIHDISLRRQGPFVAMNCGAIPSRLIQSELFGHERGAFTGAERSSVGLITSAERGTIFLDEIGELPIDMQVTLLRFLEDGTIQPVGSREAKKVDVRIIAATNVDLEHAIAAGQCRKDLYYRLNVLRINMPPLRDRGEDIMLLAQNFFKQYARGRHSFVRGFASDAVVAMRNHGWPGNVRELKNRIQRALIFCEHRLISAKDLGFVVDSRPNDLVTALQSTERDVIVHCLVKNNYNVSEAARQMGVSRVKLYRLMDKHGVERPASCGEKKEEGA